VSTWGHLRGPAPARGGVLVVVAVEEEAAHLPAHLSVLVTGAGKVNAALATTAACLTWEPATVVNVGTAGALVPGLTGTHEVGEVRQHDLDDAVLYRLTGRHFSAPVVLGDGPVLVTGDAFVADEAVRDALAATGAGLVDMEAYAVARAARAAGVGVRVVKHVSDSADAAAGRTWTGAVTAASRWLGAWCSDALPAGR
jgi:adenosylhomocysteine nucleosidase